MIQLAAVFNITRSVQGMNVSFARSTSEIVVGTMTLVAIMMMTITGNTLVIMSIFAHRPLRKVQNFFLISLSAADLLVASTVVPFHVVKFITGGWPFGLRLCQMWITFDILLCTASILNLCAVSLDRYWAIQYPISYANRRTIKLVLSMIGGVWLLSILISVPPVLGWNDWSQGSLVDSCEYTTEKGFVIYSASGSFYVPLVIMTTVYIKIYLAARRRIRSRNRSSAVKTLNATTNKEDASKLTTASGRHRLTKLLRKRSFSHFRGNATANNRLQSKVVLQYLPIPTAPMRESTPVGTRKSEAVSLASYFKEKERISVSREKKAAKTLAIIMSVFVLCWLPFFVFYVIDPFCSSKVHPKIYEASNWLGYINSSLNPIIYTIFNLDFRKAFQLILAKVCWCRGRNKDRQTVEYF